MSRSIYVIQSAAGPIKIGIATNVWSRLCNLQIGSPVALTLAYTHQCKSKNEAEAVEAKAHLLLSRHKVHGEWFNVTVETAINAVRSAVSHFAYDLREIVKPEKELKARRFTHKRPDYLQIRLGENLLKLVDDFRALEPDIPSRAVAFRRLVKAAALQAMTPEAIERLGPSRRYQPEAPTPDRTDVVMLADFRQKR